ncbi:hypothetical protein MAM1_0103c05333 [Mucor ambiguus]|uniref:Uncharacterized protein n=1 Tax=Mucor ambiguus TaxID=91626 RepID=A0A0C9MRE9_9FUNG|nr:hypothetical protein MAM1_0103c05333 [Mucor ambiguus]
MFTFKRNPFALDKRNDRLFATDDEDDSLEEEKCQVVNSLFNVATEDEDDKSEEDKEDEEEEEGDDNEKEDDNNEEGKENQENNEVEESKTDKDIVWEEIEIKESEVFQVVKAVEEATKAEDAEVVADVRKEEITYEVVVEYAAAQLPVLEEDIEMAYIPFVQQEATILTWFLEQKNVETGYITEDAEMEIDEQCYWVQVEMDERW